MNGEEMKLHLRSWRAYANVVEITHTRNLHPGESEREQVSQAVAAYVKALAAPINRPSPEAEESGEPSEIEVALRRMSAHAYARQDYTDSSDLSKAADAITYLQAELAEARKERDGEKDARRSLSMLAADEVDTAIALRDLLFRARWYVNDALEAHEHSDGRDLLREIDAALPVQALASLSPAKDEESGNG